MKSPELQREAIVRRAAGETLATISASLGIGVTTLKDLFKKHGTLKGEAHAMAIQAAKTRLIADSDLLEQLQLKIINAVNDDLALCQKARESALVILEELETNSTLPLHAKSRSLAAVATVISLTQQTVRKALRINEYENRVQPESLPELPIRELTKAEIENIESEVNSDRFGMSCDDIIIGEA